jgi:opacity protein-like surface antigen
MKRAIVAVTPIALSVAIGTALGAFTGVAHADNEKGFYVGAGVGQFNVDINDISDVDNAVEKLDDSDTSWKAFAGWRFNPYISLEADYIDFGKPGDNFNATGTSGNYELAVSGFAPYLIGTLPLGPVELFGKVGYYYYDVDVKVNIDQPTAPDIDSSHSKEDIVYGVGVGITLFEHLNARLEYERLDSTELDSPDGLWLSGAWRF